MEKYGVLKDIVNTQTLEEWKTIYKKNSITKTLQGDDCWGIDRKCLTYNWFTKKVLPIISENFHKESKLIFSSFMDLHKPLPIHRDIKDLPHGEHGDHHLSILVPYSIDNDKDRISEGVTRFYKEDGLLLDCIKWQSNSMIWWDSNMLHDSGEYKNIQSKQFFITHTYV